MTPELKTITAQALWTRYSFTLDAMYLQKTGRIPEGTRIHPDVSVHDEIRLEL